MKNYTQAEKEFVLRPIVWLILNALILLVWIIITITIAYFLLYFITSPVFSTIAAIVLATLTVSLLLKTLNFFVGVNYKESKHTFEIN